MIATGLSLVYITFECTSYPKKRFGLWFPIALAVYGLFISFVMVFAEPTFLNVSKDLFEFLFFQLSFATLCVASTVQAMRILNHVEAGPAWKLWYTGAGLFLLGYVGCWMPDFHLCDKLDNLPLQLPNPQLHAWWHVFSSSGSYCMVTAARIRAQPRQRKDASHPLEIWTVALCWKSSYSHQNTDRKETGIKVTNTPYWYA